MVHSFIIADVNSHLLFRTVFQFSGSDLPPADEVLLEIVDQVRTEFDFNASTANADASSLEELVANPACEFESKGILNVAISDCEKPTLWHTYSGCMYILVCDKSDNRLLAGRTLFQLIRTIRDILPKSSFVSEIGSRADVVSLVVNTLLPSGQLLFMHNQALQQTIKEMQKHLR